MESEPTEAEEESLDDLMDIPQLGVESPTPEEDEGFFSRVYHTLLEAVDTRRAYRKLERAHEHTGEAIGYDPSWTQTI